MNGLAARMAHACYRIILMIASRIACYIPSRAMYSDKSLAQRLHARTLDKEIANLTQRLLATSDADQAAKIAGDLIAAIRDRIDKLRNAT